MHLIFIIYIFIAPNVFWIKKKKVYLNKFSKFAEIIAQILTNLKAPSNKPLFPVDTANDYLRKQKKKNLKKLFNMNFRIFTFNQSRPIYFNL